jgi:DNA-binding MarR family transcriptional regulator
MVSIKLDFDRYVPALLTAISSDYTSGWAAISRRLFDIGVVEWRIIGVLAAEGEVAGPRICNMTGADKAAVSRALKQLQQRKLVRIRRDPSHVRRQFVSLTSAGEALYGRMAPIVLERQKQLLQALTEGERETLIGLLLKLRDQVPRVNRWNPGTEAEPCGPDLNAD